MQLEKCTGYPGDHASAAEIDTARHGQVRPFAISGSDLWMASHVQTVRFYERVHRYKTGIATSLCHDGCDGQSGLLKLPLTSFHR